MKKYSYVLLSTFVYCSSVNAADSLTDALTTGKTSVDMRLRYEAVEQNNALDDASALTLRTRLGYTTGTYKGFNAMLEMEDVRILGGVDDYTVGPTGFNPGLFSVIADPEVTEIDQGFIQYKMDNTTTKLGRQVITLDGHRFVGHVGWRQDRQTFDAFSLKSAPIKNMSVTYAYINKRNRIFAKNADIQSKDHLLNASYKLSAAKLTAYAYLLEVDNNTENALDTYGLSIKGKADAGSLKALYHAQFATQTSETTTTEFDADYLIVEGGLVFNGFTTKLGHEVLGSDSGTFGFSTPLATLHKFNGWADQFLGTPAQGLADSYVSVSGKITDGKWLIAYHNFAADESTAGVDDLGNETDLLFTKKINKIYNSGIKYTTYSAGDAAAGKVDTKKLWLWMGAKF